MITKVYAAKKIITMDTNCPEATHVAVRDGRVLAVGGRDCVDGWGGEIQHDTRFADSVMMPGLVEAHAHVAAGGIWRFVYVGHYARTDPDARVWEGVTSNEDIVARLQKALTALPAGKALVGWGLDPNMIGGSRLDRHNLDQVSTEVPVVVMHSNMHLLTANSKALDAGGIDAGSNIEGIVRDGSGQPNGELQEFAAMAPVTEIANVSIKALSDGDAVRAYGQVARLAGVTTAADLLSDLYDDEVAMLRGITGDPAYPIRYAPIMNAMVGDPKAEAKRAVALRKHATDKLYLGAAKLFTDGAIQGFTAKLKWPGYYTGQDHGILNMTEDHFGAAVHALNAAGVQIHIHTNGDWASEFATEVIAEALRAAPFPDHRHTLEHVQLADRAQFQRMANLGICVNLFGNHLHYFGDVHWTTTVGPDRARRMNACRDAQEIFGGNFAIHSDAPVTPMGPLFTAWCAVNRLTESGRQLGTSQQISVPAALRAITLGAAYVLKLDHEIGSIQTGKRADFCLLDQDPLGVPPEDLKDIAVIGTVLAGEPTA